MCVTDWCQCWCWQRYVTDWCWCWQRCVTDQCCWCWQGCVQQAGGWRNNPPSAGSGPSHCAHGLQLGQGEFCFSSHCCCHCFTCSLFSCSTPLSKLSKGLASMRVVAWLYTAPDSTVWETATTIPCSDRKRKQKSFRKDSGWSLNCLWKLRKMPILSVSEGARFSSQGCRNSTWTAFH